MQLFNSLYHNSNKVFNMAIMLLLLFVVVSTFSLSSLDGNQTDSNIGANGASNHSDSTYYTTMPTTTSTKTVETTALDTPHKMDLSRKVLAIISITIFICCVIFLVGVLGKAWCTVVVGDVMYTKTKNKKGETVVRSRYKTVNKGRK
uniref:Uncharacterized protein n=1 Tax=Meloidogyne enterolobii TaxID=390850 RepID=A0A6V7TTF8_MELEN|nr:unnamed protein product [Meloidogyne enterolobii]